MRAAGKLLQRYPSADGKRWVDLRESSDGLFHFQEFYRDFDEWDAKEYTAPGWQSGLYERVEEGRPSKDHAVASRKFKLTYEGWYYYCCGVRLAFNAAVGRQRHSGVHPPFARLEQAYR
jgi:hypothetical protein